MPYLPDAVESILRQTYADFTFIIVNDGSTDGTKEYLSSLSDPRILLINQANEGLGASLNTGLRKCQTEYVARMDADDISIPDRFFSQLEYLDAHPEVVMVGTQIEFLIGKVAQKALAAPNSGPVAEWASGTMPSESHVSHRGSDRLWWLSHRNHR
jgi:glycosyltransferase involved in cell wall biosynthesis